MSQTLVAAVYSDLIIRKSRFIGCVQPTADRSQAQTVVAKLHAQHPAATHVCWALLAGGQSAAVDDGEPSGTAGRPMLEVLRHHDLEGVLATVVRYFGGVKLGAGGLVRAYTDAVAQALAGAEKIERVPQVAVACEVVYALEGRVRYLLDQEGIVINEVSHNALVRFCFSVSLSHKDALHTQLMQISQGQMHWEEKRAIV